MNKPIYFRLELSEMHMVKKIELKMIGKASTWEIQITEDMIVWVSGVTSDDY